MICWQSSLHLSLNWKDFLLFYQLELSFVMHEIISKDWYNQANSVTHKYSFSIQHWHHSINRNFARPFPSSQEEHRSAFSVEPFFSQVERCSDCVAYMKNLMKNFDDLNVIKWTQMCYVIFINKVYFFENKIISLWMLLT